MTDSFAQELYDGQAPLAFADESYGWPLLTWCEAIGLQFQIVEDLIRDSSAGPGWSIVFDLNRVPDYALPWLGQFVGVDVRSPAQVVTRTNYIRNPNFALGSSTWATETDDGVSIISTEHSAWQGDSLHVFGLIGTQLEAYTESAFVAPGEDYSYRVKWRMGPDSSDITVRVLIRSLDYTGAVLTDQSVIIDTEGGTVEGGFTVGETVIDGLMSPEEAVSALFVVQMYNAAIEPFTYDFYFTDVLMERSESAGPYFDGSSESARWASTPGQSFSQLLRYETQAEWSVRARAEIADSSTWKRGSVAAMRSAAQRTLLKSQTVMIYERDTSPYHLLVQTMFNETIDPFGTLAALLSQKPAGIVLQYQILHGQTYQNVYDRFSTYQDVDDSYSDYRHMLDDTPDPTLVTELPGTGGAI